jgi:DNA-binding NarL/FixJ family response regulator
MIADDDPVFRSMLSTSLSGDFDVVGTAADSDQAIESPKLVIARRVDEGSRC